MVLTTRFLYATVKLSLGFIFPNIFLLCQFKHRLKARTLKITTLDFRLSKDEI